MSTGKNAEASKLKVWFGKKFVPAMNKLGSQKHLAAMRDAFGTLLPLTIAGSLGLIIGSIGFAGGGSGYVSVLGLFAKMIHPELSNQAITDFIQNDAVFSKIWLIGTYTFNQLNGITIGFTSIWFSFTFGYFLSMSRNFKLPILGGFASTIGFMATTMGNVSFFQGAAGLISAIIFGAISTEIFIKLSNVKALYIKLPDGVPPSVSKSFAVFLPFLFTMLIMASMNLVVFIPAFFWQDTFRVNSASQYAASTPAEFARMLTSILGLGDNAEAAYNKFVNAESTPAALKDISQDMFNKIYDIAQNFKNSLNGKEFKDITNSDITQAFESLKNLYGTLGESDQNIFTTFILTLAGKNDIYSFTSSAASQFIEYNGAYVFFAKYRAASINHDQFGLAAAVYQFFVTFLLSFAKGSAGGLGLALAYAFFISFLWFFGVHGSNVVNGAFSPIWQMILIVNLTLISDLGYTVAAKSGELGVFSTPIFDCFMNIGGSGASLALIIGTFVFSRRQDNRKISLYSAPCGVFQINEPIVFGFPIVLNGRYLAPFIIAPMVNIFLAWLASPGVLNMIGYAELQVPWTTPFLIASPLTYIHTAGQAFVVALVCFGASFGIYTPFILLDNILHFKKLRKENIEEYNRQMRFFNDPYLRATIKLEDKVERIVSYGESAFSNAEAQNRFWEQKLTNPAKLESRKAKNLAIADAKVAFYDYKAEIVKQTGEVRNNMLQEAWEKPRRINEAKFLLNEKVLSHEVTDIKNEKLALKDQIKSIKDEFVTKMPDIKSKQLNEKQKYMELKRQNNEKLKAKKAELKQQLKDINMKFKESKIKA
ncbi:PTS transporter subunit EIIC [Spiroplasma tabanidicola]|uniref:PTS system, cellobiose-specific IIC component n=1 Tax=Spiroplasma tabanidicola TaxID=324079 RepID=A0A6I6CC23_9MOLU|nr:PTS transporter subunit EIIC [Spiroplasma tabanidicola]QGS51652.1 PTS system, cellobiose-specific IIC component [Spiroplasma tabanidicola]